MHLYFTHLAGSSTICISILRTSYLAFVCVLTFLQQAISYLTNELEKEQLKGKELVSKEIVYGSYTICFDLIIHQESRLVKYRNNTKEIVTEVFTRKRRQNDIRLDEAEVGDLYTGTLFISCKCIRSF